MADKTSICDTEPEEQEKGHTLQMAAVVADARGTASWTLIDTPGYPDFVAETSAAMFAADLVVGRRQLRAAAVTFNLRKKLRGRGRARPRRGRSS